MRRSTSRRTGMHRLTTVAVLLCASLVAMLTSRFCVTAQGEAAQSSSAIVYGDSGMMGDMDDAAVDAGSDVNAPVENDDDHSDVFTAAEQLYRRQRMQLRNLQGNIFGMDPPKSKKGVPKGIPKGKKGSKCSPFPPDPKAKDGPSKDPKGGKAGGKGASKRFCVPTIRPTQRMVTMRPTKQPTPLDTGAPTPTTTSKPTKVPTKQPTAFPTITSKPTISSKPTKVPTNKPTAAPTTAAPVPAMFQATGRFRSQESQWWHDDKVQQDTKSPTPGPSPGDGQPVTLEPTQ